MVHVSRTPSVVYIGGFSQRFFGKIPFLERVLPMMGQKFSELIKMGEAIEDRLKSGKVTSLTALQAANKS